MGACQSQKRGAVRSSTSTSTPREVDEPEVQRVHSTQRLKEPTSDSGMEREISSMSQLHQPAPIGRERTPSSVPHDPFASHSGTPPMGPRNCTYVLEDTSSNINTNSFVQSASNAIVFQNIDSPFFLPKKAVFPDVEHQFAGPIPAPKQKNELSLIAKVLKEKAGEELPAPEKVADSPRSHDSTMEPMSQTSNSNTLENVRSWLCDVDSGTYMSSQGVSHSQDGTGEEQLPATSFAVTHLVDSNSNPHGIQTGVDVV